MVSVISKMRQQQEKMRLSGFSCKFIGFALSGVDYNKLWLGKCSVFSGLEECDPLSLRNFACILIPSILAN